MSTKFFYWDGGAKTVIAGLVYKEGAPVEYQIQGQPVLAIQAWHGISDLAKSTLIAQLSAAGWVEGEQSKSDSTKAGSKKS